MDYICSDVNGELKSFWVAEILFEQLKMPISITLTSTKTKVAVKMQQQKCCSCTLPIRPHRLLYKCLCQYKTSSTVHRTSYNV